MAHSGTVQNCRCAALHCTHVHPDQYSCQSNRQKEYASSSLVQHRTNHSSSVESHFINMISPSIYLSSTTQQHRGAVRIFAYIARYYQRDQIYAIVLRGHETWPTEKKSKVEHGWIYHGYVVNLLSWIRSELVVMDLSIPAIVNTCTRHLY